jgi:hypothetical protein
MPTEETCVCGCAAADHLRAATGGRECACGCRSLWLYADVLGDGLSLDGAREAVGGDAREPGPAPAAASPP